MSGEYTNKEILAESINRLGPHMGSYMHYLEASFVVLRTDWARFRALYGTDSERIALLNRAASFFFARTGEILWDHILLSIARFIDGNRETLSLKRLIFIVRDETVRQDLLLRMKETERVCSFAKNWRDNYIAHRNEKTALNKAENPLADASRDHVEKALKSIGDLLNEIVLAHGGIQSNWEYTIEPPTDAQCLLHVLSDGIRANEDKRKRLKEGRWTLEDSKFHKGLWRSES